MEAFNFNAGGHLAGECTLGLLDLAFKLAHGLEILSDVHILFLIISFGEVVDDSLIWIGKLASSCHCYFATLLTKIFTTKMCVAGRSLNLESSIVDGQKGDIESTASQVVDNDLALSTSAIKAIGDGGGCWFIDNTDDIQSSDDASVFRCLSLVVIEVCWDSHHCVLHRLSKVSFCYIPHLAEDHCGHFLGAEFSGLALNIDGDRWLIAFVLDFEGEVLDVGLNVLVGPLSADQTPEQSQSKLIKLLISDSHLLSVKDRSLGVGGVLILRGVTY